MANKKKKGLQDLELSVRLNGEQFIKQLDKVREGFEKLEETSISFSLEQEDEPIWHIIKRRIQKKLSKLKDNK